MAGNTDKNENNIWTFAAAQPRKVTSINYVEHLTPPQSNAMNAEAEAENK
jgi:hypothetical protein